MGWEIYVLLGVSIFAIGFMSGIQYEIVKEMRFLTILEKQLDRSSQEDKEN